MSCLRVATRVTFNWSSPSARSSDRPEGDSHMLNRSGVMPSKLRSRALAVAVAIVTATAGCTSDPATPTPTTERQPAPTQAAPQHDDQWARHMVDCLTERGWDVKLTDDNRSEWTVPADQKDRFDADQNACFDEIGYDPNAPPPPLTPEQAELTYDTWLGGGGVRP